MVRRRPRCGGSNCRHMCLSEPMCCRHDKFVIFRAFMTYAAGIGSQQKTTAAMVWNGSSGDNG